MSTTNAPILSRRHVRASSGILLICPAEKAAQLCTNNPMRWVRCTTAAPKCGSRCFRERKPGGHHAAITRRTGGQPRTSHTKYGRTCMHVMSLPPPSMLCVVTENRPSSTRLVRGDVASPRTPPPPPPPFASSGHGHTDPAPNVLCCTRLPTSRSRRVPKRKFHPSR